MLMWNKHCGDYEPRYTWKAGVIKRYYRTPLRHVQIRYQDILKLQALQPIVLLVLFDVD